MATTESGASMTDDIEFKRIIEEFKELGHEYRYREQLMVQEFGLTMIAIGGLLNVLLRSPAPAPWHIAIMQLFGLAVFFILALHLRNINEDRVGISQRKADIADRLGFVRTNLNVGGKRRLPVPRNMVRLTFIVASAWGIWTALHIAPLLLDLIKSLWP